MDSVLYRINGIASRMSEMVVGPLAYHAIHHILANRLVGTIGTKGETFQSTCDTILLQAFRRIITQGNLRSLFQKRLVINEILPTCNRSCRQSQERLGVMACESYHSPAHVQCCTPTSHIYNGLYSTISRAL